MDLSYCGDVNFDRLVKVVSATLHCKAALFPFWLRYLWEILSMWIYCFSTYFCPLVWWVLPASIIPMGFALVICYFHQPFDINWNVTVRKSLSFCLIYSFVFFISMDSQIHILLYGYNSLLLLFIMLLPNLAIMVSISWHLGSIDMALSFLSTSLFSGTPDVPV